AEDGIRDRNVTGVQTCALPIFGRRLDEASLAVVRSQCTRGVDVQLIVADGLSAVACMQTGKQLLDAVARECAARGLSVGTPVARSEERRVGKEWRARWCGWA